MSPSTTIFGVDYGDLDIKTNSAKNQKSGYFTIII